MITNPDHTIPIHKVFQTDPDTRFSPSRFMKVRELYQKNFTGQSVFKEFSFQNSDGSLIAKIDYLVADETFMIVELWKWPNHYLHATTKMEYAAKILLNKCSSGWIGIEGLDQYRHVTPKDVP
jgi:hypothetical protein